MRDLLQPSGKSYFSKINFKDIDPTKDVDIELLISFKQTCSF